MAYNDTIPKPTDQLDISQGDLLDNFQALNTYVNVNHMAFESIDQGKHKFLQLPEQAMAPGTNPDEVALYSAVGAKSGVTELVFQRELNGASIAFTEGINADNGWTRFASGLLMKWGTRSITGPNATLATYDFVWDTAGTPAFGTQFWAIAIPQTDPSAPTQDINIALYVYDLSDVTKVQIRQWRRNLYDTAGTNHGPYVIRVLAFGLE